MTKPTKVANKFDAYTKDDLLRLCLQQESELEQLRPKPAKFKMGQVLACKQAHWTGQPAGFFSVLSVELRNGKWFYGFAKTTGYNNNGQTYQTFPEDKLRVLTATEIDGSTSEPVATAVSTVENWGAVAAAAQVTLQGMQGLTAPGAANSVWLDEEGQG